MLEGFKFQLSGIRKNKGTKGEQVGELSLVREALRVIAQVSKPEQGRI
jgi:hypothetical protein